MDVLKINNHDYSKHIKRKGLAWARNDLDSDKTGRTMDGKMHRAKVAEKRTCSFELMELSRTELAQLDDDIRQETFQATYLDIHGLQTRTFYCSSFKATCEQVDGDNDAWDDASFTMIEV